MKQKGVYMIKHIPYESLGHHNYQWLDARYHFSFARYYNPARTGFGALRVINDDIIKAGAGFDTHPHENMEIITYVRQGAITHTDSKGNKGRTGAGNVQVMSAGSGIYHSEYNLESEETKLYQIWITPNKKNVEPRWAQKEFPQSSIKNELPLLVSGFTEDSDTNALFIHQNARIYGGRIDSRKKLTHNTKDQSYILVSEGEVKVNDTHTLQSGDGAEIKDIAAITITASKDSEILIIEVPEQED
jgi:hypothetical protein